MPLSDPINQNSHEQDKMGPDADIEEPTNYEYPKGLKLVLLMTSIYICMFLVALVRSKQHALCMCRLTSLDRRTN